MPQRARGGEGRSVGLGGALGQTRTVSLGGYKFFNGVNVVVIAGCSI